MFQKKTNIEIIGFKLVHFGFSLVLSDIDLQNIGLLDTHLDLLDTNIPSNLFVSLQDILKTSSRHLFKTSSIHVSRHLRDMSLRHFQDVFSVTIFRLPRRLPCKSMRKMVTLKTC